MKKKKKKEVAKHSTIIIQGMPICIHEVEKEQRQGRTAFRAPVSMKQLSATLPDADKIANAFSQIATNVWRTKLRMIDEATGQIKEEVGRIARYIEGIEDALKMVGVEIIDKTGGPYETGMRLKPISFEPTTGIQREEIKETLRPTVIWNNLEIQTGEIVVGTPIADKQSQKEEKND